jgi:hypothetical protein
MARGYRKNALEANFFPGQECTVYGGTLALSIKAA